MRLVVSGGIVFLLGCSSPLPTPMQPRLPSDPTPAVLALSDSILAAAGDRDAERFASYFSEGPGFRYLINTRQIESRAALHTTFKAMLGRQQIFRPTWQARTVQALTPGAAILTGTFVTQAQRLNGEEWSASGVVTLVALKEPGGWRVVHWHTSE